MRITIGEGSTDRVGKKEEEEEEEEEEERRRGEVKVKWKVKNL